MKAIDKDRRRRYPSAEAVAVDLRRFLADEPILARRIGPLERRGRWGRRNPLVAGLSAAIVLVTAWGIWRLRERRGARLRIVGAVAIVVGITLLTIA